MSSAPGLPLGHPPKRSSTPPRPSEAIEPISPTSPKYLPRNDVSSRRRHPADLIRGTRPNRHARIHKPVPGWIQDGVMQDIWRGLTAYKSGRANYAQPQQSPIESLASIALARDGLYKASSQFSSSQISPSQSSFRWQSNGASAKRPAPGYMETRQPPSKRARSELGASPLQSNEVSRPATSHYSSSGWGYNLEQAIDNGTHIDQQQRPTSSQGRQPVSLASASDAELLLGFSRSARTPSISFPKDQGSPTVHSNVISPEIPSPSEFKQDASKTSRLYSNQFPVSSTAHSIIPQFQEQPLAPETNGIHSEERDTDPNSSISTAVQTHTPPEERDSVVEEHAPLKEPAMRATQAVSHERDVITEGVNPNTNVELLVTNGQEETSVLLGEGMPMLHEEQPEAKGIQEQQEQLHSPLSLSADQAAQTSPKSDSASGRHTVRKRPLPSLEINSVTTKSLLEADTASINIVQGTKEKESTDENKDRVTISGSNTPDICAECKSPQNSAGDQGRMNWIHCSGCRSWFHFTCAGIKTDKEAKTVDRFYCRTCTPTHGKTTYVRKSLRAHNDVDYASLNMGVIRTSDENPEHHWIKAIKNGTLHFKEESYMRLAPELVTADFFEKTGAWVEPIVIPAAMNPRPSPIGQAEQNSASHSDASKESNIWSDRAFAQEYAADDGQDMLDMVIPQGLTVRRVAELHGPNQQLDVIDVKAQDSSTRMTLSKWADYYESTDPDKPIRNVISLEVSKSKLGRLIRRPQIVRELDLQDAVWPATENGKPNPRVSVAFYCLMSVADCYTDFHIDFGGSSVYYHIVKGKKTFFFIPPTQRNLMKYQDWCNSESQNSTFLGTEVDECFRADLGEGDTMLIPAGWIHAVWTPEDSLVIGGNFLTKLNYNMQFKIVDVEKATSVPRKFKYPMFQKVMWYTLLQYMKDDPLPQSVVDHFLDGEQFKRNMPTWREFDKTAASSTLGTESYQARYYSKSELEGLPHLASYLFRTVMISMGRLEGITQDTVKAVTKSIPKGYGSPLELVKTFAMWVAWKRGNEFIPEWAHPNATLPEQADPTAPQQKKITQAQLKKMERAFAIIPSQHSMRLRNGIEGTTGLVSSGTASPAPAAPQIIKTPKTSVLGPKRVACDACRRRRIRCKHKDDDPNIPSSSVENLQFNYNGTGSTTNATSSDPATPLETSTMVGVVIPAPLASILIPQVGATKDATENARVPNPVDLAAVAASAQALAQQTQTPITPQVGSADGKKKGRSEACNTCRRSKRRCIHNADGTENEAKKAKPPIPRGSAGKKRQSIGDQDSPIVKKLKKETYSTQSVGATGSGSSVGPSDPLGGLQLPESMRVGPIFQPNMLSHHEDHPFESEQGLSGRHDYGLGPSFQPNMVASCPSHYVDAAGYGNSHSMYQELANAVLEREDPSYRLQDRDPQFVGEGLDPSFLQEDGNRSLEGGCYDSHIPAPIGDESRFIDPALEHMDLDPRLAEPTASIQHDYAPNNDNVEQDVQMGASSDNLDPALSQITGNQFGNSSELEMRLPYPPHDTNLVETVRSGTDFLAESSTSTGQLHPSVIRQTPPITDSSDAEPVGKTNAKRSRKAFAKRVSVAKAIGMPSKAAPFMSGDSPADTSPAGLHTENGHRTNGNEACIEEPVNGKRYDESTMANMLNNLSKYRTNSSFTCGEDPAAHENPLSRVYSTPAGKTMPVYPISEDEMPQPIYSPISEISPEEHDTMSTVEKAEPEIPPAEHIQIPDIGHSVSREVAPESPPESPPEPPPEPAPEPAPEAVLEAAPKVEPEFKTSVTLPTNDATEEQQTRASTPASELSEAPSEPPVTPRPLAPRKSLRQSSRATKAAQEISKTPLVVGDKARMSKVRRASKPSTPAPTTTRNSSIADEASETTSAKKGQKKARYSIASRRNSNESVPELQLPKTPIIKESQNEWELLGMDEATWRAVQEARSEGLGLRTRKARVSF